MLKVLGWEDYPGSVTQCDKREAGRSKSHGNGRMEVEIRAKGRERLEDAILPVLTVEEGPQAKECR